MSSSEPWRNPRPAPSLDEVRQRVPHKSILPPWFHAWWPALLWSAVIFTASTDTFSSEHTASVFGTILHWFAPSLVDATFDTIHFFIRKSAHFTEYFIFYFCSTAAFVAYVPAGIGPGPSPPGSSPPPTPPSTKSISPSSPPAPPLPGTPSSTPPAPSSPSSSSSCSTASATPAPLPDHSSFHLLHLSSRAERPDFLFRAAFRRVGPRSRGIPPPSLLFSANLPLVAQSLLTVLLGSSPPHFRKIAISLPLRPPRPIRTEEASENPDDVNVSLAMQTALQKHPRTGIM